jgi:hypothetical protein
MPIDAVLDNFTTHTVCLYSNITVDIIVPQKKITDMARVNQMKGNLSTRICVTLSSYLKERIVTRVDFVAEYYSKTQNNLREKQVEMIAEQVIKKLGERDCCWG